MSRRTTGAALAAVSLVLTVLVTGPGSATSSAATAPTYTNPVSKSFADTFADPSIIRGKDGWWYSYGTSDPLLEGEGTPHRIPIARSRDLVDWTYVDDAFAAGNRPTWATADAGIWAPDIRYVDGEYRMYYVVTETTVTDRGGDNAIGMATAPSPTGPWTDSGAPVVGPRRGQRRFPLDLRPVGRHRPGRVAVDLLRLVQRRRLRRTAGRQRPHGHRGRADGRDRQQVRGRVRRAPGRLLVPLRLDGQLLRRADHRLHRAGRPVARPARSVRRQAGRAAGHVARRRHSGAQPERQPVGGPGPQRDRP